VRDILLPSWREPGPCRQSGSWADPDTTGRGVLPWTRGIHRKSVVLFLSAFSGPSALSHPQRVHLDTESDGRRAAHSPMPAGRSYQPVVDLLRKVIPGQRRKRATVSAKAGGSVTHGQFATASRVPAAVGLQQADSLTAG
jgi:hypothetical protein